MYVVHSICLLPLCFSIVHRKMQNSWPHYLQLYGELHIEREMSNTYRGNHWQLIRSPPKAIRLHRTSKEVYSKFFRKQLHPRLLGKVSNSNLPTTGQNNVTWRIQTSQNVNIRRQTFSQWFPDKVGSVTVSRWYRPSDRSARSVIACLRSRLATTCPEISPCYVTGCMLTSHNVTDVYTK
jgi:hypothetical protein